MRIMNFYEKLAELEDEERKNIVSSIDEKKGYFRAINDIRYFAKKQDE